ncbi:MgtC/SapB family protein [Altericista sp. CCNU0014]|uniref:MgtC/SapB family protein n=1 Tax=Altericista sp. CCNU0014 TaxID=3082949 RepID=UPI00384E02EB
MVATRIAIALALGLIIGMERGWQDRESPDGINSAGVRSFAFAGLLGGLSALLAGETGIFLLGITFLGFAATVVAAYVITARQGNDYGITSELALLITFVLGALAGKGHTAEAAAAAVTTVALLGFKKELHESLKRLDRSELIATIQLLLIAAVALPLLPNRSLGPWQAVNPRSIGLLVLLIAGISYAGYFAMRFLGPRAGILATAVLGALVSSTAVTLSFGRMAKRGQGSLALLGAGISLASGTMALRILLEVSVVNSALMPLITAPIALLAAVPLLAAAAIALRKPAEETTADVPLRNPIELGSALGFSGFLALLFILIRAVEAWFGNAGIYGLSALSGISDVDAVSLSLAQATKGNLPLSVGATGILIAAMVNTAVKALLAALIGGWKLARWCASILIIALLASFAAALAVNL